MAGVKASSGRARFSWSNYQGDPTAIQEQEYSGLVIWPITAMETAGVDINNLNEVEPRESAILIKRELREEARCSRDQNNMTDRNRMSDLCTAISAHAFAYKLSGKVILSLLRQCLNGKNRQFLDSLLALGTAPGIVWNEIQARLSHTITQSEALRSWNTLLQEPNGATLRDIAVMIPHLILQMNPELTTSFTDKMYRVEKGIDHLHMFLVLNVNNSTVLPHIEDRFRVVRKLFRDGNEEPEVRLSAYSTLVANLLTIPQLKTMKFNNTKLSSLATNEEPQQFCEEIFPGANQMQNSGNNFGRNGYGGQQRSNFVGDYFGECTQSNNLSGSNLGEYQHQF